MNRIKKYIRFIRNVKIISFIKYNFFYKNITRKHGKYLFPYRYSCIQIDPKARLILDDNLHINRYRLKGSKEEAYLVIQKNSALHIKGEVSTRYRSIIQVNSGAVAEFGHFTSNVGINIQCAKSIVIGDDCMFGRNVTIYDSNYHLTGTDIDSLTSGDDPVVIGNHVWLGTNSVVVKGARIGDGSIIGTNAVVSGAINNNTLVSATASSPKISGVIWARGESSIDEARKYLPNETAVADEKNSIDEETYTILHERVRDAVRKVAAVDDTQTRLVDYGMLDSLSLVSVTAELEEEFDISIPFTMVNAENFNSLRNITILIANLLPERHGRKEESSDTKALEKYLINEGAANFVQHPPKPEKLCMDKKDTEKTVVQRIFEHASKTPNSIAIIYEDKEVTYRQLAERIYRISGWLKEKGVQKGKCIIVQGLHDEICIECYYAVHLCGAILVPVENKIPKDRVLEIASIVKAKLMLCSENHEEIQGWIAFDTVRMVAEDTRRGSLPLDGMIYPDINTPCEMVFTTGTTGRSKGVLMLHRHISWYSYSVAKAVEMKSGNRFLITTPLNHAGGLRRTHLSLANGCTVVYLNGLSDLGEYFRIIRKFEITSLYLPPAAIRILLVRSGDELAKYQKQIDFVYTSSSYLPESDARKLKELLPYSRLYNAYEASETPGVSAYNYNIENPGKDCIGPANEGVQYGILNESDVISDTAGITGQLCVKSLMNMKEYYGEPELTAETYRDGWFVSSDLGHLDEEGNAYFEGRKGDVINIGGYKIAPSEVEQAALESGMVAECICVEEKDSHNIPKLKLWYVASEGKTIDEKRLLNYMGKRLEPYKVPQILEGTDRIQKTFNGKLDRRHYRDE